MTAASARHPTKQRVTIAFSYVRFSSRKQSQGDSERRQTELAEAYCRRHGWTLSDKTYEDLGVSAFHGKNALVGNLGEFLRAVQSETVSPGSVLIVESLDRISRQGIDEGYEVVKRILKAGIRLVTLTPEREFDVSATKSLSKGALEIQLILERAAEESERKSERIYAAWQGRRNKARQGENVLVAGMWPAWIEKRNGKLCLIPERVQVVRRIFQLAANGYGRHRIMQALKAEGIPPFGGQGKWPHCTIEFILTDRRALGEYQPRKRNRALDGPPIPNYYPAAVSEQEWLAARAAIGQRRCTLKGQHRPWTEGEDELVRRLSVGVAARRTGRTRNAVNQRRHTLGLTKKQHRTEEGNFVNVFQGLIHNARPPQDTYIVVTRMNASGPSKALINSAHVAGTAPCCLFQLAPFERAILGALREVDPREVLPPQEDTGPSEVGQLQTTLDGVKAELADAGAFMDANGFSETIGKRVTVLETRKKELEASLLDARASAACPAEAAWKEYGSLVDVLEQATDQRDARLRLRTILRRVIDSMWLLTVGRGRDRVTAVQIDFAGGARRSYLIWYRPTRSNGRATVPGFMCVRSWTGDDLRKAMMPAQFDLRHADPTLLGEDDEGKGAWLAGWGDVERDLMAADLEALFAGCERHPLP
jgi:DNA invertase Pin-like site-specific DNA recombinase